MSVSKNSEIAECLLSLHDQLIDQFSAYTEKDLRTQNHPDLSQLGWHLNHIAFIEQYWLREVVLGDGSKTKASHKHYFPELIDKADRGSLVEITDFASLKNNFIDTVDLWTALSSGSNDHPLLKDNYIGWFLVQHGQQHLETMQMALYQKAQTADFDNGFTAAELNAIDAAAADIFIAEGEYEMGSADVLACDNEQAVHDEKLSAYMIASKPVSNAEYLGFMQADAYQRCEFWSEEGWLWNSQSRKQAPEYWRQDHRSNWYLLSPEGSSDIIANDAVSGISWHEADAYARYAGGRLPHEFEWELAMKNDSSLMASTGQSWEWCSNTFFPYAGFQAYPYERYSTPWFDNKHYTLKGSSPFTGECVRRPAFRNFYEPEKRHIFAGLRLANNP